MYVWLAGLLHYFWKSYRALDTGSCVFIHTFNAIDILDLILVLGQRDINGIIKYHYLWMLAMLVCVCVSACSTAARRIVANAGANAMHCIRVILCDHNNTHLMLNVYAYTRTHKDTTMDKRLKCFVFYVNLYLSFVGCVAIRYTVRFVHNRF